MKQLIKLALVLAPAFMLGCKVPVRLSDNRYFPTSPEFSIVPENVPVDAGIDFHAVYYLANNSIPNVKAPGGNYYRFWPNGRVLTTFTQSDGPPSANEAERFQSAYLGYYQIRESRLEIELYAPDPGKGHWSYGKVHASIDEEGNMLTTYSRMGKHERVARETFVRMPLKGLERAPDWLQPSRSGVSPSDVNDLDTGAQQ